MNIGIVTTWFERGAAYVSRHYQQLFEQEHHVYIFARAGDYATNDPTWAKATVTWSRRTPFGGLTAFDLSEFEAWLRDRSIDLVFFNEQHWWPPVLLCHELGVITGAYIDYYTEETVPLFACYDFLICNTKRHYSVFDWHPQCLYLPWGTNIELFLPKSSAGTSTDKVTFFHSTGLNPIRKGTDLLLEAAALLPEAQLVIHSQGPISDKLTNTATLQKLTEEGRLTLHQKTVPAPGLYYLGDVYVYPSRLDGIGLTIAEALACGLPVITTDHPPMNEFVINNINGRLATVSRFVARSDGYYWPQSFVDLQSLTEQMQFYVDHYKELPAFKQQAREFAVKNLDWSHNASSLLNFIRAVQALAPNIKRPALAQAEAFEISRMTIQQKYPHAFYIMSKAYRIVKRLRSLDLFKMSVEAITLI